MMICSICYGNIKNQNTIKVFDMDICPLCMESITDINVEHVLYDYYKDRIKGIEKIIFKKLLDK